MTRQCRWALCLLLMIAVPSAVYAQPGGAIVKRFARTEALVPMRDGVKLYTTIYVPKKSDGPLPFILMRTPYGIEARGPHSAARLPRRTWRTRATSSSSRTSAAGTSRRARS